MPASPPCSPCASCGKAGALKCGGCSLRWYCGKKCQKKDWKERHKKECKKLTLRHPCPKCGENEEAERMPGEKYPIMCFDCGQMWCGQCAHHLSTQLNPALLPLHGRCLKCRAFMFLTSDTEDGERERFGLLWKLAHDVATGRSIPFVQNLIADR